MTINLLALQGLAIATAFYQNEWCPDTPIEEVLEQDPKFESLIKQAKLNLDWVGLPADITDIDIVEALWNGTDLEEIYAEMEAAE